MLGLLLSFSTRRKKGLQSTNLQEKWKEIICNLCKVLTKGWKCGPNKSSDYPRVAGKQQQQSWLVSSVGREDCEEQADEETRLTLGVLND